MLDILDEKTIRNPFPTFNRLREECPVCEVEPGGVWVVSRYSDVIEGLKNHQLFTATNRKEMFSPSWMRPECQSDLFISLHEPPEYHRRRSVLNTPFSKHSVNALKDFIHETARSMVGRISTLGDFEYLEDLGFPFAGTVLSEVTGLKNYQTPDEVREWVQAIEQLSVDSLDECTKDGIQDKIAAQKSIIRKIIEDTREGKNCGYIELLVNQEFDGRKLTTEELVNIIELIIRSGYQTVAQFLAICFIQLKRDTALYNEILRNHDLIPHFVDESLRLHPITPLAIRHATRDVTLHGTKIAKGDTVCFSIAGANRDPRVFDNADEFDLTRQNTKDHFGFGYGPHICLGLHLARLEVEIFLEHFIPLIKNFDCPDDDEINWIKTLVFRGFTELPIKAHAVI
jgi:cytochrome P450